MFGKPGSEDLVTADKIGRNDLLGPAKNGCYAGEGQIKLLSHSVGSDRCAKGSIFN
jgi:hypothetical protein